MKRITSAQNPEVKARAKLKERRGRSREGKFLVEGARELVRALAAGVRLEALYVCPKFLGDAGQNVAQEAETRGISLTELSETAFHALSMRENPDGVVGVALKQDNRLADLSLPDDALVVVCEGVETAEDLSLLRDLNCDLVQGYYMDKPLPIEVLADRWLKPSRPQAAA